MQAWSIILMVVFIIGIVVFTILSMKNSSKNQARQTSNKLIPFSGYLSPANGVWQTQPNRNNVGTDPDPEKGLFLVGMAGGNSNNVPQITCPVGTKINIVGAFVEVNDPYMTCQANASDPVFQMSCGNATNFSSAQLCNNDIPCPPGMTCYSGKCLPSKCSNNGQCATPGIDACPALLFQSSGGATDGTRPTGEPRLVSIGGTYYFDPSFGQCAFCDLSQTSYDGSAGSCTNIPLCQNIVDGKTNPSTFDYTNSTCTGCKIRDASSYLAGVCDGQESCLGTPAEKWDPNKQGGAFGPLPCNISVDSNPSAADQPPNNYVKLPIIPGWNQNNQLYGSSNAANNSSFSQGYFVHGIYTCIPDGDLPTSSSSS